MFNYIITIWFKLSTTKKKLNTIITFIIQTQKWKNIYDVIQNIIKIKITHILHIK